jgi:NTE family protein
MPTPRHPAKKTALVLQGGGARGAYHVGAIKAIAEITARRRSPFQIVCGASVGAINAASVAVASNDFQRGAQRMEILWRSLRSSTIYDTRALPLVANSLRWALSLVFGQFGFRAPEGLLNSAPLHDLLKGEFDREHLQLAIRTGALHAFCITASSYSEGKAVTFIEGNTDIEPWTRSRRRGEHATIGPEHLMASAALPFVFAPVQLQLGYYGDGSLRLTSPMSSAIHTGADRILVIATRDGVADAPPTKLAQKAPSIGEMAGHALDILFNDNLEADHERMTRINHTISLLSDAARQKTALKVVDSILLMPSQDLRDIAKRRAAHLPKTIRFLMRSIGARGDDGRMESYLMFEPDYIADLIEMGYADTMARAGEISEFLKD